mgnify:FL=1
MVKYELASIWMRLLAALSLLILTANLQAAAIQLKAGESATFNFDLSDAEQPPPFISVEVLLNFSQYKGEFTFFAYSDLDGGGDKFEPSPKFGPRSTVALDLVDEGIILDGVFSVVVTRTDNEIPAAVVTRVDAIGLLADLNSTPPPVDTPDSSGAIPLPATLPLVGVGFFALALSGLRKRLA